LDRGVGDYVKVIASGGNFRPRGKETATYRGVTEAATFEGVDFECEIYAVKMNSAGDWLITVKVPFGYRSTVTELSGAAGMNLKTHMELDGFVADRD
jgi:hypothetical protein